LSRVACGRARDLESASRIRAKRFWMRPAHGIDGSLAAEDEDLHANCPQVEMARDNESIAAVITASAADNDDAVNAELANLVGKAPPGVLHQHQARHAVLFDRAAI